MNRNRRLDYVVLRMLQKVWCFMSAEMTFAVCHNVSHYTIHLIKLNKANKVKVTVMLANCMDQPVDEPRTIKYLSLFRLSGKSHFCFMFAFEWLPFSCYYTERICALAFIFIPIRNFIDLPLLEEGRACNICCKLYDWCHFCKYVYFPQNLSLSVWFNNSN